MKQVSTTVVLVLVSLSVFSQTAKDNYMAAFQKLDCMLQGECPLDFKEAVFTVENAYFGDSLNRQAFEFDIQALALLAERFIASRELQYQFGDKQEVEKYAALFNVMTDTLPIQIGDTIIHHIPFRYDFNDIWGHGEWSNMFVSKLLATGMGNCHSMPYLYKILANELGAQAYLAVAPNHLYIKHRSDGNGWYNTELTSGIFPIDAWLMASGYIHLDAVVNRLYMEALNDTQSVALCMIDLAQGYKRKMGSAADSDFILNCCAEALRVYPHCVNALLLQAETKKAQFDALMKARNATYPSEILWEKDAKALFDEMTVLYKNLHQLGYRRMPEEMYLQWLVTLKEEKSRFENTKVVRY